MPKIKILSPVIFICSALMWTFFLTDDYIRYFMDMIPYFKDLFGNIFLHSSFEHILNNFKYVILLGPVVETVYGSKNMIKMILLTTLVISGIYIVFFPSVAIVGFSGIVYMLIGAASVASIKKDFIPLMCLVLLSIFVGEEVYKMIFSTDNVAHLAHIIGAICGIIYGIIFKNKE